jgi:hypothetical protein
LSIDRFEEKERSSTLITRRLKEEIDSWRPYAEALRQEDREIFREMLNNVAAAYSEAVDQAERGYDTEAVMMSILLDQQRTINWLSNFLKRMKEESAPAPH